MRRGNLSERIGSPIKPGMTETVRLPRLDYFTPPVPLGGASSNQWLAMTTQERLMPKKKQQEQPDFIQSIFVGIAKALWWLIRLPFGGLRNGRGKAGLTVHDRNYLVEKRLEIEKVLKSDSSIELKHALIEADKLVDHTLKLQRYYGETFADRLRNAQNNIQPNLCNVIWQGHKVRNEVVHEQGNNISNAELKTAAEKLLRYIKSV